MTRKFPPIDMQPKHQKHLYTRPTWPLWECIAEFIKTQGSRKILDVGSGFGCPLMLNKFLVDYDYEYFGFDCSKEIIDYANTLYKSPNITFCHADWNQIDIQEEFDCMLLLGVLPYHESGWDLFKFLTNKFPTKQVIIRETTGLVEWNEIKLVDLTNFEKIATEHRIVDVGDAYTRIEEKVLGKKVLYNVITSK